MKYTPIYPWQVIDRIKDGHKIYALDRKLKQVSYVNDATITAVVAATESDELGRYEFWYEEEEVENAQL